MFSYNRTSVLVSTCGQSYYWYAGAQVKPKLSELQRYIGPHAADHWEELSIVLELGDEDDGQLLEDIKTQQNGDPNKCFMKAMRVWLKGTGRQPASWEVLYSALQEVPHTEGALRYIKESVCKGELV